MYVYVYKASLLSQLTISHMHMYSGMATSLFLLIVTYSIFWPYSFLYPKSSQIPTTSLPTQLHGLDSAVSFKNKTLKAKITTYKLFQVPETQ